MAASLLWGGVSASSLLIGAVLGVTRTWNPKAFGLVLGFGAGALISGISFQLARGGYRAAGPWPLAIGLAAGALVFYLADRAVEQWAVKAGGVAGLSLALGGLLDGLPEQAVLGIDLSHGGGVSIALLMAIFVSNLPESIGSSTQMHQGGTSMRYVMPLWLAVTLVCVVPTWLGYLGASVTHGPFEGLVDGFAAGALLVMLVGAMIPEAQKQAGRLAGLVAVLGFAVASGLAVASQPSNPGMRARHLTLER
jgi:zinc transporter, ZIP family